MHGRSMMRWLRIGLLACSPALARDLTPTMPSPVRPTGGEGAGMAYVTLDLAGYSTLRSATSVHLTGFPLGPGRAADLDLTRFDVFSADAQIVLAGDGPDRPMPRPEIVLLRGSVAGVEGSSAFLGLSPTGMNGYILLDGHTYILSSGPPTGVQPAAVYDVGAVPPEQLRIRALNCGTDLLPRVTPAAKSRASSGGSDLPTCRVVRVALETDYEYTSRVFGGNTTTSAAYAATLLGAITEIYMRDLNASLEVVFLRVWGSDTDPYSSGTVNDRLGELLNHWNANMTGISRAITHMFTGISAGAGGVAYLGVLCNGSYGYGTSGYLGGSFPYPLVHNNGQNWDVMVVAHEIGHNFNAPHTHDMTPPVDGCGSNPQDCSNANLGTIMSYCHTCAGGMNNIRLEFHPRTIDEIVVPYLAGIGSCVPTRLGPSVSVPPVPQAVQLGASVQFSVVAGGGVPFTYSWRKFGVALANNGHFSGVDTPTLTISPVQALDGGQYSVRITNACGTVVSPTAALSVVPPCYANCDNSTTPPLLNVVDFACFLNRFASADPWANCDQSTAPPVLNVNDFSCFLNRFAAGCP